MLEFGIRKDCFSPGWRRSTGALWGCAALMVLPSTHRFSDSEGYSLCQPKSHPLSDLVLQQLEPTGGAFFSSCTPCRCSTIPPNQEGSYAEYPPRWKKPRRSGAGTRRFHELGLRPGRREGSDA